MRKIKANKEKIFDQFNWSSMEMTFYLDTKTGGVACVSEFGDDLEEDKEINDLLESDPKRFAVLPDQDSSRGYDDMADFAKTIKDDLLAEKLAIALDGSGCFRRFKGVLECDPEAREQWFEFEKKRRRERFEEWLEDEEIEIVG
ncbi:MAG: UPF0158 family protein [Candidatus Omnitrophica bacterium]|nr:UPF0158 family protein [Candidatus Omnitrophota bacterium]